MSACLSLHINGKVREFPEIASPVGLASLLEVLGLKADRIAVEHNGQIVPRSSWVRTEIADGDRLEIVHFVGGGTFAINEFGQKSIS